MHKIADDPRRKAKMMHSFPYKAIDDDRESERKRKKIGKIIHIYRIRNDGRGKGLIMFISFRINYR